MNKKQNTKKSSVANGIRKNLKKKGNKIEKVKGMKSEMGGVGKQIQVVDPDIQSDDVNNDPIPNETTINLSEPISTKTTIVSNPDPYFLEEATYIKREFRWRNKQRVLLIPSRGIGSRYRHLFNDLKRLLVHAKTDHKYDKSANEVELKEIAELHNCNNIIYMEMRKHVHAYMYLSCAPNGPTAKFMVTNIHTLGELNMGGNALHGSRPLLFFDAAFDDKQTVHLQIYKQMLTKMFGIPRNHPKSKPFIDRVISFSYIDGHIWFRHYQIIYAKMGRPQLSEIGPRFVLEPIKILAGVFSGAVIYKNETYHSPSAISSEKKRSGNDQRLGNIIERRNTKRRTFSAQYAETDSSREVFG